VTAEPATVATPGTVGALLAAARDRLAAAGIEEPQRDARLLLAAATGWSAGAIIAYPERTLTPAAEAAFAAMVARRASREPVSRILGRRSFWKHDFLLGPGALDPRPDSELLVEQALRRLPEDAEGVVVDLGVGSGCLLLSVLADRPRMRGVGVDISADALAVAAANAAALGLAGRCSLVRADWTAPLRDHVADCVLANPPYISSTIISRLAEEVHRFDPMLALDGGKDGLEAYRRLVPALPDVLKPGGVAVIEIGFDQGVSVAALLREAGLAVEPPCQDLGGRDRCVVATAAAR